jgi:hypothetical protein
MGKDSQKSRTLQQKIQEAHPNKRNQYFQNLFPFVKELVFDQFGNFVFQKLCEYLTNGQQIQLTSFFQANFFEVSDHQIACKVLQRFIGSALKVHIEPLFAEAKSKFVQLCLSANGNHIIQSFVTPLPEKLDEIMDLILPHICELAVHNCGCKIVHWFY